MPAGRGESGSPSTGTVSVRRGGAEDAEWASSLHESQIGSGFLSTLGPSFLRRLYRRIALTDDSFLLVAGSGGSPVGFVAGSFSVGRLYKSFLVRDALICVASAPGQLLRAWRRSFETLRHGLGRHDASAARGAELLAIAVEPTWRRRGVGRQLVESFLLELEARGAKQAHVVVGSDNDAAIAMYRDAGFGAPVSYAMHRGTVSVVLHWPADATRDPERSPKGNRA